MAFGALAAVLSGCIHEYIQVVRWASKEEGVCPRKLSGGP